MALRQRVQGEHVDVVDADVVVGLVLRAHREIEVVEICVEVGGGVGIVAPIPVVVIARDREERGVVDPPAVHRAD